MSRKDRAKTGRNKRNAFLLGQFFEFCPDGIAMLMHAFVGFFGFESGDGGEGCCEVKGGSVVGASVDGFAFA